MKLFHTDLDNTIIYSYKHSIGSEKRCVEIYREREVSFITDRTYALLKEMKKIVTVVPTTTRTVEQYRRIDLGTGPFPYALAANGGILLVDGEEDALWYQESLAAISESREELVFGERLLEKDKNRCMEVRDIRGLLAFTKSEKPLDSVKRLKESLDMDKVDVFGNGVKVYIVPKKLNKGTAVLRLKERLRPEAVIAAGDSAFDIPMLNCADLAIAPAELSGEKGLSDQVRCMTGRKLFSEELLAYIKKFPF